MKHTSLYLEWLVTTPKPTFDFRSSGIASFPFHLDLHEVDLGANYPHGNPQTTKTIASRYQVSSEHVFLSCDGASGQNTRMIRLLSEENPRKNEAIVEYPTYEPLLRLVQEYFPRVKRIRRDAINGYHIDVRSLQKMVTQKTGLLVITNPHAPSGMLLSNAEIKELMMVAQDNRFYVLCDEIYAEFDRKHIPPLFSYEPEWGIVTTSFTKAYGLGGLNSG